MALFTSTPWLLVPAALLGGFGRGANGAAGPFGPLEQAWLAHGTPPALRSQIFSLNSTLGMLGMALGAVLGAAPHWLIDLLSQDWAYRSLFVLPLLGSAAGFFLLGLFVAVWADCVIFINSIRLRKPTSFRWWEEQPTSYP